MRSNEDCGRVTARSLCSLTFCLSVLPLASWLINRVDSSIPVVYSIDLTRDGRSSATRIVRSLQGGALIFFLTASFQKLQHSNLAHGMPSPVDLVPAPETMHGKSSDQYPETIYQDILKSSESLEPVSPAVTWARDNGLKCVQSVSEELAARPIDFRYVSNEQVGQTGRTVQPTEYRQYVWFKANGSISDDSRTNAMALAYASDHDLINTTIRAHEMASNMSEIKVMVSLDHIMYFHDVVGALLNLAYEVDDKDG